MHGILIAGVALLAAQAAGKPAEPGSPPDIAAQLAAATDWPQLLAVADRYQAATIRVQAGNAAGSQHSITLVRDGAWATSSLLREQLDQMVVRYQSAADATGRIEVVMAGETDAWQLPLAYTAQFRRSPDGHWTPTQLRVGERDPTAQLSP